MGVYRARIASDYAENATILAKIGHDKESRLLEVQRPVVRFILGLVTILQRRTHLMSWQTRWAARRVLARSVSNRCI